MGSFSFLVNYTCKIVFVSSIFAVSIIMYIYFLFLHLSHSQTHAAGRQALKDAWLIWPINCHCQGREGEGEREKISLTLNAHLLRKKERMNWSKVQSHVLILPSPSSVSRTVSITLVDLASLTFFFSSFFSFSSLRVSSTLLRHLLLWYEASLTAAASEVI